MVMCEGYLAPAPTIAPVVYYTPIPTPKPTIKVIATLTPTPTESPTPSPEVQGALTESTPSPVSTPKATPAPLTTGGTIGVLAFLTFIVGLPIWVIIKIVKKFRKPKV
jgi:hypothetical protein